VSLSASGQVEASIRKGAKTRTGSRDLAADRDCEARVGKRVYGGDLARTGANRRERRSREPNGPGESCATQTKRQAGNFDPAMVAWKRAVIMGERKAVARRGFQPDSNRSTSEGVNPPPLKKVTGSRGVIAGLFGCKALSRACRRRVKLTFAEAKAAEGSLVAPEIAKADASRRLLKAGRFGGCTNRWIRNTHRRLSWRCKVRLKQGVHQRPNRR
jgi:hypothetical protein